MGREASYEYPIGLWRDKTGTEDILTGTEKNTGRANPHTVIRRGTGFEPTREEIHYVLEGVNLRKGALRHPFHTSDSG